jgi:hypothetical protein
LRRLLTSVPLLLAQAFGAGQASALQIEIARSGPANIVVLRGEIEPGDTARVEQTIRLAGAVEEVWLASPGGSLREGLRLGRFFRRHGLPARVPDDAVCASACVYAFAGAPLRRVAGTARLGVHMSSLSQNVEMLSAVTDAIAKHGAAGAEFVVRHIEQASARAASEQASFLVEMSISLRLMTPVIATPHDDIYWLSSAEMRQLNVVNTD